MAWAPRFSHLFKVLFRIRDVAAAEGLFLEGSIEFEAGNLDTARLMFFYGSRLDPETAGNFYNLAVVEEKTKGMHRDTLKAWEDYLAAAARDPRQSAEAREKVRGHVEEMKAKLGRG